MAYNYYGTGYQYNPMSNPIYPQSAAPMPQSFAQQPTQPQVGQGMIWVDGEVGAKAYQMPQGWPVGTPVPLWDTNDPVIYLKSINQMGMPNPLQKIHYTMEEQQQSKLPASQMSGDNQMQGAQNFATKEDFEQLKKELKESIQNLNQNGSKNEQNRGVNR